MRSRLSLMGALASVFALVAPNIGAQQVTGRVTDQRSGAPLAAVQVFVAGSGIGGLTQQNGRFLLLNVPVGTHTISAQRIGYGTATAQVTVGAGATVVQDFSMSEEALGLDEIVVTGVPGDSRRRTVGNVVTSVNAAALVGEAPISDMRDLLSGRIGGVSMIGAGMVGGGSKVHIRGLSSLSLESNPLIYIDGVRVANEENTGPQSGHGANSLSRLGDLNPQDIQSIEVLKGPSAATLYGTEASGGVINIITKRGVPGQFRMTASTTLGANYLANPAGRFFTNWWKDTQTGEAIGVNQVDYMNSQGVDLFQDGLVQSYNLSMTGGGESMTYFLSGTYDNENGFIHTNWNKKFSGRANLEISPSEEFRVSVSTGYTNNDVRIPMSYPGTVAEIAYSTPRNIPENRCRVAPGPTCSYYKGFWSRTTLEEDVNELNQFVDHFTGSVSMTHEPLGWLTNRLQIGVDWVGEQNREFQPYLGNDVVARTLLGARPANGRVAEGRVQRIRSTYDLASTASFDLTESLNSSSSVGLQYYTSQIRGLRLVGEEFAGPGLSTLTATASQPTRQDQVEDNNTLGSYFQETLAWRDRLFLTGAVRVDNNSAFGDQIDLIVYPKYSLSWVADEEGIFENIAPSWWESLRLRFAYGESGAQPPSFVALRTYAPVTTAFGTAAVQPATLGNPELKAERGKEIELGFDASFVGQAIDLSFTYFNKKTRDAILLQPNPPSGGFPGSRYVNAGAIASRGVETELKLLPISTKNLSWDVSASFAWNTAEIQQLSGAPGDTAIIFGTFSTLEHRVGYPPTSWFWQDLLSAEYDATTGKVVNHMCADAAGGSMPCYNAKGQIQAPRVYQGRTTPPYDLTISSGVSLFNSLRINALVGMQWGHKRFDNTSRIRCTLNATCFENVFPGEGSVTLLASIRSSDRLISDYIQSVGFARLREVSVSYDLPSSIMELIGASSATVGVAGRNLWTKTNKEYHGMDPEAMITGTRVWWDQATFPHGQRVETNVRVSF